MRKLVVLLALAGAACNPDLRAEKRAWERYYEQRLAAEKTLAECRERFDLEKIGKDQEAAANACKPLLEAAIAVPPGDREAWLAAYRRQKEAPSCAEEARLRDALREASKNADACRAESVRERDARGAEYLAACGKCADQGRCEENLRHDYHVQWMRTHPQPETPADRAHLEWIRKEIRSTELVFGCAR